MAQVSFLQLNCNKSRATSTCLTQLLAEGKNQIALLQEPHEYKNSLTNLDPSLAKLHVTGGEERLRAAIVANPNLPLWFASKYSTADMATAVLKRHRQKDVFICLSLIHI